MTPAEIIAGRLHFHIAGLTDVVAADLAKAAIAALDKEGFVIVPRTPTEKMLVAGIKVCSHAAITNAPQTAVIYGQPKDIYQAMIKVAKAYNARVSALPPIRTDETDDAST